MNFLARSTEKHALEASPTPRLLDSHGKELDTKQVHQDRLLRFSKELSKFLREHGYKRKNKNTWVEPSSGRIQVINLQKSSESEATRSKITLNLAIIFPQIWEALGTQNRQVEVVQGHWISRIGTYSPGAGGDIWWWIEDELSASAALQDIQKLLMAGALCDLESITLEKLLEWHARGLNTCLGSDIGYYAELPIGPEFSENHEKS